MLNIYSVLIEIFEKRALQWCFSENQNISQTYTDVQEVLDIWFKRINVTHKLKSTMYSIFHFLENRSMQFSGFLLFLQLKYALLYLKKHSSFENIWNIALKIKSIHKHISSTYFFKGTYHLWTLIAITIDIVLLKYVECYIDL